MDGAGTTQLRTDALEALASLQIRVRPQSQARDRGLKLLLAGLVVAVHLGLAWLLVKDAAPKVRPESRLLISFITRPAVEKPSLSILRPVSEAMPARSAPAPAPATAVRPAANASPDGPQATAKLKLFGLDGRLQLADDALEQIDASTANGRDFEFQQPGLDKAEALMQAHVVIEYVPTRFNKYWKPEENLLDEILRKAVEMSTKTVTIPIPGNPNDKIVCQVVLLAAGGGCSIQSNGAGELVVLDDPATLSPEEDRQCAQWWSQIVDARSQAGWRQTRRLYEQYCRKPLQRGPASPPHGKGLPKEP